MAEFLSPAWIAALDEVARSSPELAACAGDAPFVLEQRVVLPDGTESVHHLRLAADGARVIAGAADDPDVMIVTDLETASDIARGETTAQRALANARLRVRGDVEALTRRAEALLALDDLFAGVRAETTFPEGRSSGRR